MKLFCFLFPAIFFVTSCNKEDQQSIIGKWTIIERMAGTGGSFITSSYAPLSEMSIEFKPSGDFFAYNYNSSISSNALEGFDRYQIASGDQIKLYKTSNGESLNIFYSLKNNLRLDYQVRCGFTETFIRN